MQRTLRSSKQRNAILQLLRSTDTHPTADWIYHELKKTMPELSLATVYRNLALLAEQGIIMELAYGSSVHRFDGNPENHYHFVCHECGRVFDVDLPVKTCLDEETASKTPYHIEGHRLEFFGVCNICK